MAKREFKQTIKQLEVKGFEKVGASFEGTFVGTKDATIADSDKPGGERAATIIILQPDTGDRFGVWANPVLEDMIAESVKAGAYIRITHTGLGKPKGKKQGAKLFEIQVAE